VRRLGHLLERQAVFTQAQRRLAGFGLILEFDGSAVDAHPVHLVGGDLAPQGLVGDGRGAKPLGGGAQRGVPILVRCDAARCHSRRRHAGEALGERAVAVLAHHVGCERRVNVLRSRTVASHQVVDLRGPKVEQHPAADGLEPGARSQAPLGEPCLHLLGGEQVPCVTEFVAGSVNERLEPFLLGGRGVGVHRAGHARARGLHKVGPAAGRLRIREDVLPLVDLTIHGEAWPFEQL
jgi:hypothetical protein